MSVIDESDIPSIYACKWQENPIKVAGSRSTLKQMMVAYSLRQIEELATLISENCNANKLLWVLKKLVDELSTV